MIKQIYIVYDPATYQIRERFAWFNEAQDYADARGLRCINSTHPTHKELLPKLIEQS